MKQSYDRRSDVTGEPEKGSKVSPAWSHGRNWFLVKANTEMKQSSTFMQLSCTVLVFGYNLRKTAADRK